MMLAELRYTNIYVLLFHYDSAIWYEKTRDMKKVRFDLIRKVCGAISETEVEIIIPEREPGKGLFLTHRLCGQESSIGAAIDMTDPDTIVQEVDEKYVCSICEDFRSDPKSVLLFLELIVRAQSSFTIGPRLRVVTSHEAYIDYMTRVVPYAFDMLGSPGEPG